MAIFLSLIPHGCSPLSLIFPSYLVHLINVCILMTFYMKCGVFLFIQAVECFQLHIGRCSLSSLPWFQICAGNKWSWKRWNSCNPSFTELFNSSCYCRIFSSTKWQCVHHVPHNSLAGFLFITWFVRVWYWNGKGNPILVHSWLSAL